MMQRTRTLFGPAGNSERFYAEGHKASVEAPAWIAAQGLTAMEYSAGRGVSLSQQTANLIGERAKQCGVAMSLHAPYFINCATPDSEKREKTFAHLLDAARACDWLGGDRVVFHAGSPTCLSRAQANALVEKTVREALTRIDDAGLSHIRLCPETMGRPSQIGTLDETLALCMIDGRMIPTLDFGHLHTIGLGALKGEEDFRRVLERMIELLGIERARAFHAHFSRIEYTNKGEKRHVRFEEAGYGPDFAPLAPLIHEYGLTPTLICESSGTQADDAMTMKRMYEQCG